MPWDGVIQAGVAVGLFLVAGIGGLICWQLKVVHGRIDKYTREMDAHIRESVEIQKRITALATTLTMHLRAHGHDIDFDL